MAKKELRLTFNKNDDDIVEFLNRKTSKTAYIKDIVRLHMKQEEAFISCSINGVQVVNSKSDIEENIKENNDYDFDISDLGL